MNRISVGALWIGFAFLGSGCEQAPDQQVSAARQAVDGAKMKEAETYAAGEYGEATVALNSARAEIEAQNGEWFFRKDYSKATSLLAQAQRAARTAETTAEANKAQAREQAETSLKQAEEELAAAEVAFQNAPRGKGTEADLEALKADLESARGSLAEARKSYEAGRYIEANSQLGTVIQGIKSVSAEIQQAQAKTKRVGRG